MFMSDDAIRILDRLTASTRHEYSDPDNVEAKHKPADQVIEK
jgi:hypothetical protein